MRRSRPLLPRTAKLPTPFFVERPAHRGTSAGSIIWPNDPSPARITIVRYSASETPVHDIHGFLNGGRCEDDGMEVAVACGACHLEVVRLAGLDIAEAGPPTMMSTNTAGTSTRRCRRGPPASG